MTNCTRKKTILVAVTGCNSGNDVTVSEGQILIYIMNDYSLQLIGAIPNSEEKYIGFNSHFSS